MSVKLRKYQDNFHFSIAPSIVTCHLQSTARGWAQGPNPRRSIDLPTKPLTQRNTTMAMKKKAKKKKAMKKS
jgi:hypothetical protein